MKNHGIIATDWQLKAASEHRLRAIMLPMQPQPKATNGAWWWYPEMSALPIYCHGDQWGMVYNKLPYKIGNTVFFQEKWDWRSAHTMPVEAAQQKFLVTDVQIQQMRDLCPTNIVLRRKLGWLTAESNPRRIKQDWEASWNTQFPEHPWHRDLFVTIILLEPKQC